MTLQHWKIYRKIAGGREVQTNSAEKLIERDRGDPVLPREASTGRLSRENLLLWPAQYVLRLRLTRSSCTEIFSLVN